MAENLFKMAAYSGKFIKDGGGSNDNDVIDNACEDVRAPGCARKSRTSAKA